MILLYSFIGGFIALILFFIFYKSIKERSYHENYLKTFVILKIVPSNLNEKTPAIASNLLSILHGLYKPLGLIDKFFGKKQDVFSFEVVKLNDSLQFFLRVSKKNMHTIIAQLYSHYPESEIYETKDYFHVEKADVSWTTLRTKKSALWSIKKFSQFESTGDNYHDTLGGVLQSFSDEVGKSELAGFQVSLRPFNNNLFRSKVQNYLKFFSKYNVSGKGDNFENAFFNFKTFSFVSLLKNFFLLIFTKKREEENLSEDEKIFYDNAKIKMNKIFFETDIRIFYAKAPRLLSMFTIKPIISAFNPFSLPESNELITEHFSSNSSKLQKFWTSLFIHDEKTILDTEEIATLFHLPHNSINNPFLEWVSSRKIAFPKELPLSNDKTVSLLGKTNFRGKYIDFGIRPDDRRRHIYIIGKTGMGKSTLLENMLYSDIQNNKGVAVVDPHGDLADAVLSFIPKRRTNDVIYFSPSDTNFPISFNILECKDPSQRFLVASGVMGVFKKMFADSWGPRLEHILRNVILSLIEADGESILGILRMLADNKYKNKVLKKVTDPIVLSFWEDEFNKWQPRQVTEAAAPIQNKVGQFLSSSIVRNILGQNKSSFGLRFAMDTEKIMVINLSKGNIGEDVSTLLGAMLITKFQLDVMSRSDIKSSERKDFYLYVDEFQNFATSSFATILSEARKYKLNLTVANQYLSQMDDEVKEAIFGNIGSIITFQVGFDDAKILSDQFGGDKIITPSDIGSLPKYQVYSRLMIEGMPSPVFSSNTHPPPNSEADELQIKKIINFSRERYAQPKDKIEDKIKKWINSK
jgi:hypothetical protein